MPPKKKKIPSKFPCRCGHSYDLHGYAGIPIGDEWCEGAIQRKKGPNSVCDCQQYVSDNLKFLEQRSKKKGKGE